MYRRFLQLSEFNALSAATELGLLQERHSIAELKTTVAQQQKQIEALTATVQKVSEQVALSNRAPQLVANP